MLGRFAMLALALASGCSFDTRNLAALDAEPPSDDARDDGNDAAPLAEPHLLLSEIKTSGQNLLREFIEIYNPTTEVVDLGDVYLADNAAYARLPAIIAGEAAAIDAGDFIVRFPSGASIGPGGLIVVAMRSSVARPFLTANFAIAPTDATPRMEAAFAGAVVSTPELKNDDGEGIALFAWDGETDLVTDLDLVNAGFQIAAENALPNKTGLAIDGPDSNDLASPYQDDAFTMPMMLRSNGANEAFVRVTGEIGELRAGGNGSLGHDETSEDIRKSWSFAPETPGTTLLGN